MGDQAIFLIQGGSQVVLLPQPYKNEDLLQQLLVEHPEVIAGGTTEGGDPGQLLLVRREMGIPTSDGGSSTFSLDHLFLDQNGVPVVVEVKRSSDTRIRREVVGQMLDYAANATRYWPVSQLRASLATLQNDADDPASAADEAVGEFIGGGDVKDFWKSVEANLRSGRIRMMFVADEIPDELARVIEFLNEQMSPAEVLGVEVPQYLGEGGVQVLVPTLVGATKAAADNKQPDNRPYWTRESFLEVVDDRSGPNVVSLFDRLFDHVEQHGGRLSWGKGVNPGVAGWYWINGTLRPLWNASTGSGGPASHPYLYFYFPDLKDRAPDRLSVLVDRLDQIVDYRPGLARAKEISFQGKGAFPNIRLDALATSKSETEALIEAVESAIDRPSNK